MSRVRGALAVVALALPALPVAAEEQGKTLPAWVEKKLEAANPYVGAASDVYGGASSAIDAAKVMRNSDLAREVGNKGVRHAQAMEYNLARKTGQGYVKAAERFHLGAATTIADIGSTLTAQAIEGDWRSMPGTVANAGVKNAVTSGGAWAVGTAGAAAGSFFGPVGTLVGGAVGAGLGALGVSWGYDAAGEALKANGYQDVQGYVDALLAEPDSAGRRQAQQNRREWLLERGLTPIVGGDADFVKPAPLPPEASAAAPAAASSLIPEDCVIDLSNAPSLPEWHRTMRISQGAAWLHAEEVLPGSSTSSTRSSPIRQVEDFTGRLRDNVVSGTGRHTSDFRSEQWWKDVPQHCLLDVSTVSTTEQQWIFLPGGEGRMRFAGRYKITRRYSAGCPYKPGGSESDEGDTTDEGKATFRWKLQ